VNHAAKEHIDMEMWWATVYCDVEKRIAQFTFVDNGIGIFQSGLIGPLRRAARAFGILNNASLLKRILRGEVESSTGLRYRGKGFPSMYDKLKKGLIRNLIIISNDVYANVAQDDYRTLDKSFRGTFLSWEHQYDEPTKVEERKKVKP
jgi:hypothetical protein